VKTEKDFKDEMISGALKACEKYGYPNCDEPLCLLIEDTIDSTLAWCRKNPPPEVLALAEFAERKIIRCADGEFSREEFDEIFKALAAFNESLKGDENGQV
jgi:hypothetical protein